VIRVALVDDQAIVRAGLARILSPADGFEVMAECADGREAVERLPALLEGGHRGISVRWKCRAVSRSLWTTGTLPQQRVNTSG
jgi:hypothetical protein